MPDFVRKIEAELEQDLEKPLVREPKKFTDLDVTTSFAHLTPNLTVDEIFGYHGLQTLAEQLEGKAHIFPFDYDGITPSKDAPRADVFETNFKQRPTILSEPNTPPYLQPFQPEEIRKELNQDWEGMIINSMPKGPTREAFTERFLGLTNILRDTLETSENTRDYLAKVRVSFLKELGIKLSGAPESANAEILAQKLEEDYGAGHPFWRSPLPREFNLKHKSNGPKGTYLFRGVNDNGRLVPVKFDEREEIFSFFNCGELIEIPAPESPGAFANGILHPTVSILTYAILSPSRVPKENGRTTRIHLAGNFMAGQNGNGYAKEFIDILNREPGYDRVELVGTEYDGRGTIQNGRKEGIGIGVVLPHFGRAGLTSCLENEAPTHLQRNEVLLDD